MPYGEFKKKFPPGYAPPAIMVYYFQERSSIRSGGYNLPNFDDIRRDVGAKNVIRLPLPGESKDPQIVGAYREMLQEFLPPAMVEPTLAAREKLWQVLVLMHEIIGHGSGTYDVSKYAKGEDPISGLGSLGSALEEQRADLTALVFVDDPILVEIGTYKSPEEAKQIRKSLYDYYLADFLRRTSGQRTFAESHQRGHWLFVKMLLDNGAAAWAAKDGGKKLTPENQVLVVRDYAKFQETARELLQKLQMIKATRDEKGLAELFAKEAPLDAISLPWAQAIIARGRELKINSGHIEQPWNISKSLKFEPRGGTTLESIAPFWKQRLP
jgi:dipeptidyl-peptidase-3